MPPPAVFDASPFLSGTQRKLAVPQRAWRLILGTAMRWPNAANAETRSRLYARCGAASKPHAASLRGNIPPRRSASARSSCIGQLFDLDQHAIRIAEMINAGKLVAHVGAAFPLAAARTTHEVCWRAHVPAGQDRHAGEAATPASIRASLGNSSGARPVRTVRLTSPTRSARKISPSPEGTTSREAASGANQRVFRCDFSGHLRSCRSTASRKTDTSQTILPRELARFS